MQRIVIQGGRPLEGRVRAGGAKNAALPLLAAALLTDEPCWLENVPDLRDIGTMLTLLGGLGVGVERTGGGACVSIRGTSTAMRPPTNW